MFLNCTCTSNYNLLLPFGFCKKLHSWATNSNIDVDCRRSGDWIQMGNSSWVIFSNGSCSSSIYIFWTYFWFFFWENITLKKFPFSSDLHDYLKTIYGSLSRFLRFKDITLQKPRLVPVNNMKIWRPGCFWNHLFNFSSLQREAKFG